MASSLPVTRETLRCHLGSNGEEKDPNTPIASPDPNPNSHLKASGSLLYVSPLARLRDAISLLSASLRGSVDLGESLAATSELSQVACPQPPREASPPFVARCSHPVGTQIAFEGHPQVEAPHAARCCRRDGRRPAWGSAGCLPPLAPVCCREDTLSLGKEATLHDAFSAMPTLEKKHAAGSDIPAPVPVR